MITESVTVEAKVPRELPYAATSELKAEKIELLKPKDLTDVLSYTPGTYVSTGAKSEWGVKLRGLGTNRITLLYDGIPVYEPYYNSFDVKAITADQVDSVKVVKGASSILYGPNTMGGIVDVLSKRPATDQFTLRLDYGTRKTYGIYANGALRGQNVLFTGSAFREASDGFNWVNDGETELRLNSDYERTNLGGKLYFYPGNGAEIMAEVNYYQSEYGIPTATDVLQEAILALQGLAAPDGQPGRQLSHARRRLRQGPAVLRQALQRPGRLQERPVRQPDLGIDLRQLRPGRLRPGHGAPGRKEPAAGQRLLPRRRRQHPVRPERRPGSTTSTRPSRSAWKTISASARRSSSWPGPASTT